MIRWWSKSISNDRWRYVKAKVCSFVSKYRSIVHLPTISDYTNELTRRESSVKCTQDSITWLHENKLFRISVIVRNAISTLSHFVTKVKKILKLHLYRHFTLKKIKLKGQLGGNIPLLVYYFIVLIFSDIFLVFLIILCAIKCLSYYIMCWRVNKQ